MNTKETITGYFGNLKQNSGWATFFSEDMTFISFSSPPKQLKGRATFLEATKGFYGMIRSVEVRELLVDADKACALTHYQLQPPQGASFTSDVAEVFRVTDGKIISFEIYFDTRPYPK